jgi:hypothetical protein
MVDVFLSRHWHMSSDPTFLARVGTLSLRWSFLYEEFSDFSFCQNVTVLSLSHCPSIDASSIYPTLTAFNGESVELWNFDISDWTSAQIFPNVTHVFLNECVSLLEFPQMPKLRNLKVLKCPMPRIIPSFPSLNEVLLEECDGVEEISCSYTLKKAVIRHCNFLKNISALTTVQTLHLECCSGLRIIPSLKNVRNLTISNCILLRNLPEMLREWSDSVEEKRTLELLYLPFLVNFSFAQNIYSLTLSGLPGLTDCQGIQNIHYLQINDCKNLVTLEGLGTVTKSLYIRNCPSLRSTEGVVESIPKCDIRLNL